MKLDSFASATVAGCALMLLPLHNLSAATISNTHDSLNRLTNTAYSDGSRELYSYDSAGNRLSRVTLTTTNNLVDLQSPVLTVLSTTNNAVFFTNLISFNGVSTDAGQGGSGIESVTLNGVPTTGGMAFGTSTSQWSTVVSLLPGYNLFRIVAQDASINQNRTTNDLVLIRAVPENEPPIVIDPRVFSDSRFEATLVGNLGTSYGVWASSNLITWTLLTNVTLTNWVQQLTDSDTTNYPHRFYRFSLSGSTGETSVPPALLLKVTGLPVSTQPITLGDDGLLFGTIPGGIFALDSASLNMGWGPTKPSACSGFPFAPVSVTASGIVFGVGDWNQCGNGKLVAYSANNGTVLWEQTSQGLFPRHVAAIDDSRSAVYCGATPFRAFDFISQSELWQHSDGYYIGGRGLVLDQAGNAYVGWYNGNGGNSRIYSYDYAGSPRWNKDFSPPNGPYMLAFISPSTLLDELDGNLEARNATNGEVVWATADLDNPVSDTSDNLYCNVVSNPEIVSLTSAGVEQWRTVISNTPSVSLDFISANGLLLAHGTNKLFAISSLNGLVVWTFTTDAPIASPAALGAGGRIVLSDSEGGYYLLNTAYEYAPSSWPVARYGNRRHTGKASDILTVPGLP